MASKRKSVSTGALDLTTTSTRKRPKEQPEHRSRRSGDDSQHQQHFSAAGDGRPIVPRYKGSNATGRLPPTRPQQAKDPGTTSRSRSTARKAQQLGSPALNSLRLVPIPDPVVDQLVLLNRFDARRGPMGLLRFRKHRAFTAIAEGVFSYTGGKAILKREPVVKAGGHRNGLDPMSWLLDDDERLLKPLKAPKTLDLQALSASEGELEVGDFGPIIFGPTADDVDWGPRNVLGKFLLSGWAQTVVDSLMPLPYMTINRTDLDLSQESLAELVYPPCPSAPLVGDKIGGELDHFIQELLKEDEVMVKGLKETLCAERMDELEMDAESKLSVDPFGSSEPRGQTLLKMLVHETEPRGCRAPHDLPIIASSLADRSKGESDYDDFMSTLFEPSIEEPLSVPAAPYMNLLLDEDLDGSDYGDVLGTLSKFKLPFDEPWPLFPNVSLASAVRPLLLNLDEGLDVKPLEKRASSSRQERSFTLTAPVAVTQYFDAQELKLGGMRDMPERQSLLPRLVQLLNSEMVDFELGAGTKPVALLTCDGQWSFRGASECLDEMKPGFGDFIPLAIYNGLAGIEAELLGACATIVDDAYAMCRKEPMNLDIEHRYVLNEPLPVVPTVPAQYVPAVKRVNVSPPEPPADAMQVIVETPTVAKSPRSGLQQDDLLGILMSTVRARPTAHVSQPSARMAQRASLRKQTQHTGAAPVVEREPEPVQVKPKVPRRLLASERILELMDDLVLELLEHKITLVDAPFAEVDLILDERTACCLLGLGDMKTAEDARALKDYIEGIMALSGCFETVVLILIGDPVESRVVIRRIHLALINTPVELILRTCQNATELSSLIRVIVDESIRRREERMTYDQDNWLKTTSEVTSQATFLSLFPSINYWVACLMLSSLPLRQLLSSPANTLHSMFPSVPSEWLTDFAALTSLEWREPDMVMDVVKDEEQGVYMTSEAHGQWQPEYEEAPYSSNGPSRKPARVHLSHRPGDPQTRLTFAPL